MKPDATPEEVAAVAEGGGQQIFAQAVGGCPYQIYYISDWRNPDSSPLHHGMENHGPPTAKCKKGNRT